MKTLLKQSLLILLFFMGQSVLAQQRRPIDSKHPLWLVHVDVWNKADPQKIINLIPDDIKPYVCLNLSLSCQYDTARKVYKMPQNAIRTYKSWASVCQANKMWFTCQPASGGHTHIQDNDLETFEYFYKAYPNFLGWNYAEQFWGFDETNDKSSSSQSSRIALFAKLVPMAHRYGGFLTVSFCGNIWSHPLNPVGMLKRNADLLAACQKYPEAMVWLYKYTTSSCFYNNESVTIGPFIAGLSANYGVRYDNCGWNGALDEVLGKNHGKKYPVAAGIGTVMEQTGVNGGTIWDGPELIWTEDFQNLYNSTVDGFTRRNWGTFPGFRNAWIDMFRKVIDGTLYIPTREEVVAQTKVAVINDVTQGSDEDKYAAWGSLYDGLYKQDDPFNRGNGQWMSNGLYLKKTGRYGVIPVMPGTYDAVARSIPVQVKKSAYASRWSTELQKVTEFNSLYAETSEGDLFVSRVRNQLVTYTPYSYLNSKTTASASIPLQYNTCEKLRLTWGKLSSGVIKEYADHIVAYLNNYRIDTTTTTVDRISVVGATSAPTYTLTTRGEGVASATATWDAENGVYTIDVAHNGPVDLNIRCSGNAGNRRSDLVDDTPLSAELPVQPAAFRGSLIGEAEDMDYRSIKSCVLDPYNFYPQVMGHAGNGFMDMGTSTGGYLRHTFNVAESGEYRIAVRYTLPSAEGNLMVAVNGVSNTVVCAKTATNQWLKASFVATLQPGENRLLINNKEGLPMYIDQVIYTPADIPAEQFGVTIRPSEHGTVTASRPTAEEGATVTLQVTPDEGYELMGWEVIHGDITLGDDLSFVMPDDNVTLAPLFRDVTSVYKLDYTTTNSGTMPEGWCAEQGGEVHEYPNAYGSGARTFVGFTGYQGKALYWREVSAEYGSQSDKALTLEPGSYKLTFAMAAWKGNPQYSVTVKGKDGQAVLTSSSYTAAPNANGDRSADVSSAQLIELPFTVQTAGDYVIRFSSPGGFNEYLLLDCRVNRVIPTGISALSDAEGDVAPVGIYTVSGVKTDRLQRGMNIVKMSDGSSRKIFIR